MVHKGRFSGHTFRTPQAFWYMRGVFYKGYCPIGDYGIQFESPSAELVEIVRYHLHVGKTASVQTVLLDSVERPVYQVRVENARRLNDTFGEMGLNVPEGLRMFPDVTSQRDLRNLSRGFLDALLPYLPDVAGGYEEYQGRLPLYYNTRFLRKLCAAWVKNRFIKKGKRISEPPLLLGLEDRIGLRVSLYRNLEYLQKYRLCLTSSTKLLSTLYTVSQGKIDDKIIDVLDLIIRGVSCEEIALQKGYSNLTALCRFVKNKTGKTMIQLLGEYRVQATKVLGLQQVPVRKIQKELGFQSYGGFFKFIHKATGKTPTQFLLELTS